MNAEQNTPPNPFEPAPPAAEPVASESDGETSAAEPPVEAEAEARPELGLPPVAVPPPAVASATQTRPAAQPAGPRNRTLFVARLLQALWLGGGVFLMFVAAPAAFRAADSGQAANVVGAMLTRWHYVALLIPALLILIEWHRMRPRIIVVLFIAVIAAAAESAADLRIRAIREQTVVPISSLSPADPVRRQFGLLHAISSALLLAQVVCAVASIAVEPDRE